MLVCKRCRLIEIVQEDEKSTEFILPMTESLSANLGAVSKRCLRIMRISIANKAESLLPVEAIESPHDMFPDIQISISFRSELSQTRSQFSSHT